ncbi:amylase-binding adhesin AbpA [Streptococcus vestibularis]|uniref:amylase-binding adhesin AbpA n=1 Tax=Streptococcus vestibularis TaxID=1343 RepID=UPI0039C4B946|nr:amylase-binding protein [Streptococcus sp.]
MKKVLLTSAAVLAVFASSAAVFASDNSYSSNALIQKHYTSERDIADEANTQVAAHDAEIREEAQRQYDQTAAASVKEAEAKLNAFLDSGYAGHDFTDKKNALEAEVAAAKAKGEQAYNEVYNTVRNRYVQKLQEQYRAAAQAEGKYWNDPTGVQDNKTKEMRDAEDKALNHGGSADVADTDAKAADKKAPSAKANANKNAKAEAKAVKAAEKKVSAAKANANKDAKALPNTAAVK